MERAGCATRASLMATGMRASFSRQTSQRLMAKGSYDTGATRSHPYCSAPTLFVDGQQHQSHHRVGRNRGILVFFRCCLLARFRSCCVFPVLLRFDWTLTPHSNFLRKKTGPTTVPVYHALSGRHSLDKHADTIGNAVNRNRARTAHSSTLQQPASAASEPQCTEQVHNKMSLSVIPLFQGRACQTLFVVAARRR